MYNPKKAHYLAATAILVKDGKYLITKRGPDDKAFPNEWTVPGGGLETEDYISSPKDTSAHWYNVVEKALKREVLEEVGLKFKNLGYLTSLVFIRSDKIPSLILSFYADCIGSKVKLCEDLTEYAWVTLKEAKKYKLIEGIIEELEMLDKKLRGKKIKEWRSKK